MGEFNYKKEYEKWKWGTPKNYNIGFDVIDKHADGKNKNKVALYWVDSDGLEKKFTFWALPV